MKDDEFGKDYPFLAYRILLADISFTWTGIYGDFIEVRPGGMYAPVTARIATFAGMYQDPDNGEEHHFQPKVDAVEHLRFFQHKCDAWLMEQFLHQPGKPDRPLPPGTPIEGRMAPGPPPEE